ncbi:MAG: SWIM zinc finger family protein [Anaerolineae bacterium]|jgi:uncharacterized Zn finger protein
MAKRRRSYYREYWYGEQPIAVEDGIRARSRRGKFVENWWANRWIAALKPLMDAGRLSRGRTYARKGQVIDIEVEPGRVRSRVQGTRPTPYRVTIELKPLSDRQWGRVLDALAGEAIHAAQLLSGEMPADVETVFDEARVALFPTSKGDLTTDCSCPDWANPCKHIAAVYYLLGERFDEDPFLLFELRGRSQAEIADALRERRAAAAPPAEARAEAPPLVEVLAAPQLEESLADYWTMGRGARDLSFDVWAPEVELSLLKRLGLPGLPDLDKEGFRAQMERVYTGVTERALYTALADTVVDASGEAPGQ